jgi:O-antigen/teichoic acid export membrane protein
LFALKIFFEKIIAAFFRYISIEKYFSAYLVRNLVQMLLLQCLSLLLAFVSNYVLLKLVGVSDYGEYVYVFNFIYLLVNFCLIGTDTLVIRNLPVYEISKDHKMQKGVVFFSIAAAFLGSIVMSFVSVIFVQFTPIAKNIGSIYWFLLVVISLPMLSVTVIIQSALQGERKIPLSQFAEKIIKPGIIIIAVLLLFFFEKEISFSKLITINLLAIGVTLLITFIFYQQHVGARLKNVRPAFEIGNWKNSAAAFFLIGILYIINSRIDIVLLGAFKGNREVGVYNIVLKISEIIGFVLAVVNLIISPVIAKLYAAGDMLQLRQLMTRSAQIVLICGFPLFLLIVVFRKYILSFFGVNFSGGDDAMIILASGQMINILCGSVGTLLIMTGYQKFSFFSLAVGMVFNIVLNILLTPRLGLVGTAMATASSLAIWNLLMLLFVRRKLKVFFHPFKLFRA